MFHNLMNILVFIGFFVSPSVSFSLENSEVQALIKGLRLQEAAWELDEMGKKEEAKNLLIDLKKRLLTEEVVHEKILGSEPGVPVSNTSNSSLVLTFSSGIRALFKSFDNEAVSNQGVFYSWGRYQFDVAAYVYDEYLGLNIVPLTVFYNYKGIRGSLSYWIKDCKQGGGGQFDYASNWKFTLFDRLILNRDRNERNMLLSPQGRLVAVDHNATIFSDGNEDTMNIPPIPKGVSERVYKQVMELDSIKINALFRGTIEEKYFAELNSYLERTKREIKR